jgi:hypothetical protein
MTIIFSLTRTFHVEEQNKQLYEEIRALRDRLTERLETYVERSKFDEILEELNFARNSSNQARLEKDNVVNDLQRMKKEREEQEQRIIALRKLIEELEIKNQQLNDLMNKEIDQQAEEYKQKTMKNLLHSAKKTSENLSRILGYTGSEMEVADDRDFLRTATLNYEQKTFWENTRSADQTRVFEKSQEFNTRQEIASRPKSPDQKSKYFNAASEKM